MFEDNQARREAREANNRLNYLIKQLGLSEYRSIEKVSYYPFGDGILQEEFNKFDSEQSDLELLMEYLGLEFQEGKRVVKKKQTKGRKK